jgi:catechol 2,3-dioxygenase-like lactoylglutathione lyase family enzyme
VPDYGGSVLVADIHHVSINVSDTRRALAFYEGILGMAVLPRPDFSFGGAWLDAGNGRQIHLIEGDVPPSLGQHVAFRVDVGDTAIRQAFAHDPDGNLLEFSQPS